MTSTEPLLASWQNEKPSARIQDNFDDGQYKQCSKARHRFNIVGLVLSALMGLAVVRLTLGMINYLRGETQPVCNMTKLTEVVKDFKDITSSEKLEWHPCFEEILCARLTVPMDYNRPLNASKDNPKVDIALVMVPGIDHTLTGKYSKSPLLLNPGGPGGSGASFARLAGRYIQQIVGLDQDVIGFDPRGIGETTPLSDCYSFPSDGRRNEPTPDDVVLGSFHRFEWTLAGLSIGLVNSSADSLAKLDTRARTAAMLCKAKDDIYGQDSILRHVSTPAVAHDILSIIDAWDAWIDGMADARSSLDSDEISRLGAVESDPSLDTKGKLVYWGFSYGTLLGATFAAMFPDRVGRVILDGVIDADHYVSPIWAESLRDTDAVEASFFKYCHRAGPLCKFYRTGDTEADILARFRQTSEKLKENPINGIQPQTLTPMIFTHDFLKQYMFQSLYMPMVYFPFLAAILDILYRGDEEALLSVFYPLTAYPKQAICSSTPYPGHQAPDAQLAIMCSDKRYPLNESIPSLQSRFEAMSNISSYADLWTSVMLSCSGYAITPTDPPMRWDDHPSHRARPIKTSFPLLFISNTADPVTPLFAGVKMARKFVGAGLIEQLSEGHCSISCGSVCTIERVRAYLNEGVVPPVPVWGPDGREVQDGNWVRCERSEWPWMAGPESEGDVVGGETEEAWAEIRRLEAWRQVRERVAEVKFWGMPMDGMEVDREALLELMGKQ